LKNFAKLAFICCTLLRLGTVEALVEYDTPDAHVVVIRPMDQWNPDESSAKSLDTQFFNEDHHLSYYDVQIGKSVSIASDDGLAKLIRAKYSTINFSSSWGSYAMMIGKPVSLNANEAINFIEIQNQLYETNIYSQGNPQSLPSRISNGHDWSKVLTLATIGLAGAKFGGMAAASSVTFANQIGSIPTDAQKFVIAAKPSKVDFSKYHTIEVRMTAYGVRQFGQVIIAYKRPKTKESEDAALLLAIASTGGLDTTKEAMISARTADRDDRQAIWNKCIVDGKCKGDE